MNLDQLKTQGGRKQIIEEIESKDNLGRKNESFKQNEIYRDRIKQFLLNELREQFSEDTIKEMPLVKSVNIAKRCVNSLAVIYNEAPDRKFKGLSSDQEQVMWNIYHDMKANKKLGMANKFFKLHNQCLIQIVPQNGKLIMRVLHPHQWDAIQNQTDPEQADAIIVSAYDKSDNFIENDQAAATGVTSFADTNTNNRNANLYLQEQKVQGNKLYVVWTKEENFIMNSKGEVIGDVVKNPIGALPFVEVSDEKDFEYWVRSASAFTDFTVEFCAALTETRQTVKMQSFAVAIVKAPKEMKFNNFQIGPNYLLHLPYDKNAGIESDFQFASPSADIDGSIRFLEVLLSGFLSSNGINPKEVSMNGESQSYNSGLDRLLALIDKMEASKEDYDVFQWVETQVYELIKKWLFVLNGTATLSSKYYVSIPADSEVIVDFEEPEMVKTEQDKLDIWEKKINLELASKVDAIADLYDLTPDEAKLKYIEIQQEGLSGETAILPRPSQPNDQLDGVAGQES